MSAIARARKKQCVRIANLKKWDANINRHPNARGRKSHIHRIAHNNGWVTNHKQKENIIHDHFHNVMGRRTATPKDLNWDELPLDSHDLHGLDTPFTEEEVMEAINQMPSDKAPSPDGFTSAFFKKCCDVIRRDLMCVVQCFDHLHVANL